MPRPYSNDLRARVIEAIEAGASRRNVARKWPARAGVGCARKACLIRPDWCLSTKRGRTPAWFDFEAVARGERLIGYAPQGHWKTFTFVAGLRHRAMVAPFVLEGAINGRRCFFPM